MHAVWPIVLLLLGAPAADKPSVAPTPRVRATGAAVSLLEQTRARSATVRDLLARLADTDVIVYIEVTTSPQVATARTKLVTATPSARFLRIGVSSTMPPPDLPSLVAHELQHALEIAERPDVRDDEGVRRLYARIGHQGGHDQYETDAARIVERRVRRELRGRSSDPGSLIVDNRRSRIPDR
jgi:hypothetical protein